MRSKKFAQKTKKFGISTTEDTKRNQNQKANRRGRKGRKGTQREKRIDKFAPKSTI